MEKKKERQKIQAVEPAGNLYKERKKIANGEWRIKQAKPS